MLKDRRVFVAVISSTVAMIFMFFFDSILSDHLLDIGISDIDIGYFFALICFAYFISALFVNWLSKKMKRRFIT
jgi:predicted MFS family arabinose efflux permease